VTEHDNQIVALMHQLYVQKVNTETGETRRKLGVLSVTRLISVKQNLLIFWQVSKK